MKQAWARRRWMDFRWGHSTYLIFLLTFSNFVLIFHRLLVERVEFLEDIFSELWLFALIFVVGYIPLAIAVGAWHRRTQLKVENEQVLLQNPFLARNFRMLVDILEKRASKEEIENFRKLMKQIEDRADLFSLDSKKNDSKK